jgi:hypothetical protein
MVDVASREEFDALAARVTAAETGLVMLESIVADLQVTPMPQDVKDALIKVLEWLKVNV